MSHVSIQTPEIYTGADSKLKNEELEAAYMSVIPNEALEVSWESDSELKAWLKSLNK